MYKYDCLLVFCLLYLYYRYDRIHISEGIDWTNSVVTIVTRGYYFVTISVHRLPFYKQKVFIYLY